MTVSKILVVDDEFRIRQIIRKYAEFEGYEVEEAVDGMQAISVCRQKKFDLIIGNPPYKKISKDAPEALAMPEVCHGAPNLYFLFAAMGIFNLKENGQMVYITPRSWTSGAYFESFRKYLIRKII